MRVKQSNSSAAPVGVSAWGDESVRMACVPPMYLLAASMFCDVVDLSVLKDCKPRGAKKLHWMDMNRSLRRCSLEALAALDCQHVIVVASGIEGKKQERARRKCLEVLLPYLESQGVGLLTLGAYGDCRLVSRSEYGEDDVWELLESRLTILEASV